ncbi:SAM-dependent methyltransferase [Nonomuraea rhizosphaerae]|uniref:SAM-dependent methyltransferase n=1 Tax=Nonomuraea rhizosphaerae TaxID=2665663 RepID=UPI001C5ECC4C|nr:SAM-dependent methyltransferase [Nonomuraea rhizosphaerae]
MERESLGFDPNTPNVARLYDYYLGGKDHFPADRAAAERILRVAPEVRLAARANRAFLGRAVRFLAGEGIIQFLDIGTGLPTRNNVHEVARSVAPDSRVVYVDHDPVVLVHARALLAGTGVAVVEGDLRQPHDILKDPVVMATLDLTRPVAVLLVAIMHYVSDAEDPARILAAIREHLPAGSHLVLSHGTSDARAAAVRRGVEVYRTANSPLTLRGREEIEELFEGFELVEPGLTWLPEWRPDQADTIDFANGPETSLILGGVGRKN